jgi:hypothetical protein
MAGMIAALSAGAWTLAAEKTEAQGCTFCPGVSSATSWQWGVASIEGTNICRVVRGCQPQNPSQCFTPIKTRGVVKRLGASAPHTTITAQMVEGDSNNIWSFAVGGEKCINTSGNQLDQFTANSWNGTLQGKTCPSGRFVAAIRCEAHDI